MFLIRRFTLTDLIVHCLKKGKGLTEQLLAAESLALLFIQFGNTSDGEAYLSDIRDTLVTFIKDEKLAPELRAMVFLINKLINIYFILLKFKVYQSIWCWYLYGIGKYCRCT